MIYVHCDWGIIPDEIKTDLATATAELDAITDPEARKKYISDNKNKWAAVRDYLRTMSHGKCWYSEARERVSRYQVDHYRPHGRAKQAMKTFDEGYSWLAFDLENYRLAGALCNTQNQEYADDTVGKGDWFPLLDPTVRARLTSRDVSKESPVLLDPVDPQEPYLLVFKDNGTVEPDPDLDQTDKERVSLAIKYLGLSQSHLDGARRKTWRACIKLVVKYNRIAKKAKGQRTSEEQETLKELTSELISMSKASSEFSSVARCCLRANRLHRLVMTDELAPLAEED